MDEITETPQETSDSRDSTERSEQQNLQDATLDPHAEVEQSGNIRQAEEVQETFTRLVENTPKTPEGEDGHPPEPPDLDHNPFPEESLAELESDSLMDDMPEVRGDIDQATVGSSEPGGDEATPINLPGPQEISATPQPIPHEAQGISATPQPIPHEAQDISATPQPIPDEAQGISATPQPIPRPEDSDVSATRTPEKPQEEARFEKPILQEDMENLGSGMEGMEDPTNMLPGEGKLKGAPGEADPGRDLLEGMPGLEGFKGGPADLKNDAEMGSGEMGAGKGHDIPGWESPFPPGKGPNKGMETQEGGSPKPQTPGTGTQSGQQGGQQGNQGGQQGQQNPDTGADVKLEATFYTAEAVRKLELAAMTAHNQHDYGRFAKVASLLNKLYDSNPNPGKDGGIVWEPGGGKDSIDPEMGGGKDPNIPLSQQMDGERVNPKFDQDQISNYPEDHTEGRQGGGKPLSEEQAKALKRTLEHKAKIAGSTPKVTTNQVTDPPEPTPKKSADTTEKDQEGA